MTTQSTLTEEEKRIKIAEFLGYDLHVIMKRGLFYRENAHGYTDSIREAWKLPRAEAKLHEYPHDEPVTIRPAPLPDFFHDLNAMAEAEKTLTAEQCEWYWNNLCRDEPTEHATEADGWFFHFSAAKRAETFGLTLNLWP